MKEYTNEELAVKFSLPDKFTIREVLAFRERVFLNVDHDSYSRYWEAAIPLVQGWECASVKDPAKLDLDKASSMQVVNIVHWTANTVAGHMSDLDDVPKKS